MKSKILESREVICTNEKHDYTLLLKCMSGYRVDSHCFIPSRSTFSYYHYIRGTQQCSWLMHCATRRKVAGSIPGGVLGIFH